MNTLKDIERRLKAAEQSGHADLLRPADVRILYDKLMKVKKYISLQDMTEINSCHLEHISIIIDK